MPDIVRLGRYTITLRPSIANLCRKADLDPKDLCGYEMEPELVYSAGRWYNWVDLEPQNRRSFCVGAEVTLVFRGGQRLSFWWGTDEPWAEATIGPATRPHVTHDALGEVAQ